MVGVVNSTRKISTSRKNAKIQMCQSDSSVNLNSRVSSTSYRKHPSSIHPSTRLLGMVPYRRMKRSKLKIKNPNACLPMVLRCFYRPTSLLLTRTMTSATAAAEHHNPPLPLRTTSPSTMSTLMTCRPSRMSVIIVVIAFILLLPVVYVGQTAIVGKNKLDFGGGSFRFGIVQSDPPGILPPDLLLLESSVYTEGDFKNAQGIAPTYWNCSSDGNCDSNQIWGPCFAPHGNVHWKQEVAKQHDIMAAAATTTKSSSSAMPPQHFYKHEEQHNSGWNHPQPPDPNDLANTCRPGFLIIGAGKCGTRYVLHYIYVYFLFIFKGDVSDALCNSNTFCPYLPCAPLCLFIQKFLVSLFG